MLSVFCDGGARGNPGPAAIGIVIKNNDGLLHQFGRAIGIATNNVAEYTAVIQALQWLIHNKKAVSQITFYLDSQLVVSQLTGIFKIKNAKLRMLVLDIRQKEAVIGAGVMYKHIPREQNREADALVNKALDG